MTTPKHVEPAPNPQRREDAALRSAIQQHRQRHTPTGDEHDIAGTLDTLATLRTLDTLDRLNQIDHSNPDEALDLILNDNGTPT